MNKRFNGTDFLNALKCGAAVLNSRRAEINELNVFPIPDGDTGDNMLMSFLPALSVTPDVSLSVTAKRVAEQMLHGARGNSGVILSRIFAGFADGIQPLPSATVAELHQALRSGIRESYAAIPHPEEGTMLTVFRDAVERTADEITDSVSYCDFAERFVRETEAALERTPDQLSVLREADVVDSGGAGLLAIAQGISDALHGKVYETDETFSLPAVNQPDFSAFTETSELTYGYCTDFLLRLQTAKGNPEAFSLPNLISYLTRVGESTVAFREGSIVKVHVHTKRPGNILNHCQKYGEFLSIKIENMNLQHNEQASNPPAKKRRKTTGIVAVATGDGMPEAFRESGCDAVIRGGQSMNPSAQDFLDAFESVNAKRIFVLPNNSNVILAAKQAVSLYDKSEVYLIPTKTVGEGFAALSQTDFENDDAEEIVREATEGIASVVTGLVSRASRTTEMNGVSIRKGDYIGYVDETVYISSPSRFEALSGLASRLSLNRYDIALLLCGKDVPPEEAERAADEISRAYPSVEVIPIQGGQPIYDYILTLE